MKMYREDSVKKLNQQIAYLQEKLIVAQKKIKVRNAYLKRHKITPEELDKILCIEE